VCPPGEKNPFPETLECISIRAAALSKFGTAESIGVLADVSALVVSSSGQVRWRANGTFDIEKERESVGYFFNQRLQYRSVQQHTFANISHRQKATTSKADVGNSARAAYISGRQDEDLQLDSPIVIHRRVNERLNRRSYAFEDEQCDDEAWMKQN
jgi:hypothetical protein